jgi:hypothetical protein
MTRDEALAILDLPREEAVAVVLALAEKAEKYDLIVRSDATTPSGMTPVYLKQPHKRRKPPGRAKGHPGAGRRRPVRIDRHEDHTLDRCPDCHAPLGEPVDAYRRVIEDLPPVLPLVTEHTIHRYWCPRCRKIVSSSVADALPNAMMGIRLVVFTAWLHYLVGVSVNNIRRTLSVVCSFPISAGGLTQAWKNLAHLLEPPYRDIGQKISRSAVLNADETGWRINGVTHWLWCFAAKDLCYYLITKSRGSPVVKEVLGVLFEGILICDFWGAYNKITALAKQRCFYHLFTELVKVDKANTSVLWRTFRKKLTRLLKDAIRLSERKKQMPPGDYDRRKRRMYGRLRQLLNGGYEDKDARRLIKRLKRHKEELFTFLDYENVSPYNNHGEQQMRKPVLTRKVSQQNRSQEGAMTQAILMTLFRSAELQGNNPLETMVASAKAVIGNGRTADEEVRRVA